MITRRRAVSRPNGRVDVDRSHGLSKGLVFAVFAPLNGYPRDLISGKYPTLAVGAVTDFSNPVETGSPGVSRNTDTPLIAPRKVFKGNGTGVLTYGRTGADSITGAGTVFADSMFQTNGASRPGIVCSAENANGFGFNIHMDDANRVTNGFWLNGENNNQGNPNNDSLGTNSETRYHRFAMAWTGSQFRYYSQRSLFQSESVTFAPTAHANRVTKLMGRRDDLLPLNGGIGCVLIYNRCLDLAEYKALYDNPYQILRPALRYFVFAPTAGGVGRGLFRQNNLTGLGDGGSFYQDFG